MEASELKNLLENAAIIVGEFFDLYDAAEPYHGQVWFNQFDGLGMELDETRTYRLFNSDQSVVMQQGITWDEIGAHCVAFGFITQDQLNDALAL